MWAVATNPTPNIVTQVLTIALPLSYVGMFMQFTKWAKSEDWRSKIAPLLMGLPWIILYSALFLSLIGILRPSP